MQIKDIWVSQTLLAISNTSKKSIKSVHLVSKQIHWAHTMYKRCARVYRYSERTQYTSSVHVYTDTVSTRNIRTVCTCIHTDTTSSHNIQTVCTCIQIQWAYTIYKQWSRVYRYSERTQYTNSVHVYTGWESLVELPGILDGTGEIAGYETYFTCRTCGKINNNYRLLK